MRHPRKKRGHGVLLYSELKAEDCMNTSKEGRLKNLVFIVLHR